MSPSERDATTPAEAAGPHAEEHPKRESLDLRDELVTMLTLGTRPECTWEKMLDGFSHAGIEVSARNFATIIDQ